jgi:hypothetical protein
LFNFFLEEELSDHKSSLRVLVYGFEVDSLFDGFELIFVSQVAMHVSLCCTSLVGLEGFEDGGVGL